MRGDKREGGREESASKVGRRGEEERGGTGRREEGHPFCIKRHVLDSTVTQTHTRTHTKQERQKRREGRGGEMVTPPRTHRYRKR